MLYLLDANVLIDANRDYYSINRVPQFWEWIVYQSEQNKLKIPEEIYDEITQGNDELKKWLANKGIKAKLILDEALDIVLVRRVIIEGYANDLSDVEIESLGRDPFLIAYALKEPLNRIVVTTEVSKPSKQRQNKHVPDVCKYFGIRSMNTFELVRELDFRTDWQDQRTG